MEFKKAYTNGLLKGKKIKNNKYVLEYLADIGETLIIRHDNSGIEMEKLIIDMCFNTHLDDWEILDKEE